jgi:hypothetical protein
VLCSEPLQQQHFVVVGLMVGEQGQEFLVLEMLVYLKEHQKG